MLRMGQAIVRGSWLPTPDQGSHFESCRALRGKFLAVSDEGRRLPVNRASVTPHFTFSGGLKMQCIHLLRVRLGEGNAAYVLFGEALMPCRVILVWVYLPRASPVDRMTTRL